MHNDPSLPEANPKGEPSEPAASAYPGADIVSLLRPLPGERILDIGCGNGDLTARIAAAGAFATGIDLSPESVERARQRHPGLDLQAADACRYRTEIRYDAVFSRAALHWIKDADAAARTIWLALREGGRFAAEFAGSGNVAAYTDVIAQALTAHGYAPEGRIPWYLPTIGEYAGLLERTGFRVAYAQHFDNPSPLKNDAGIRAWLDGFAGYFFADVDAADRASIYDAVEAAVRPRLYRDGRWIIDTSRLRIVAVKPHG
ncbi:class I SAM-dependent methyltransferase [Cohnella sp. JJ-181]|uniref:class I SAM-dependent methyltransferase n=1 Tax=Cohnella rhizoplanae TaxID=2974897 RepID=UPI0022FFC332|nr:class I SAM-dependent methyltransferase [Cohnella sp. JJ-181]CAI6084208.1 Trans-aconitate 2-methyltransferase [Cohnella sp. JJ-181]